MQPIGPAVAADDHLDDAVEERGAAEAMTPVRESPHIWSRLSDAQTSVHDPAYPLISPHSPDCRFDVTRESPRLDEFLLSIRRFSA